MKICSEDFLRRFFEYDIIKSAERKRRCELFYRKGGTVTMSNNYIKEEYEYCFKLDYINNNKGIIYCWVYNNNNTLPFLGHINYGTKQELHCVDYITNEPVILKPLDIAISSNFVILPKESSSNVINGCVKEKLLTAHTVYKFNCEDEYNTNVLHKDDVIRITYNKSQSGIVGYALQHITKIKSICENYLTINIPTDNKEAWLEDWYAVVNKRLSTIPDKMYEYYIYPKSVVTRNVKIDVITGNSSDKNNFIIEPVTNTRFDFPTAIKYLINGKNIRNVTWSSTKYLMYDAVSQVVLDETHKFVNIMKYAHLDNWEIKE